MPSLSQLLSYQCLAFARSRWPKPGRRFGRAPHPGTYPSQKLPLRVSPLDVTAPAHRGSGVSAAPCQPCHLLSSTPFQLSWGFLGVGQLGACTSHFILPAELLTFPNHFHKIAEDLPVDIVLEPFCSSVLQTNSCKSEKLLECLAVSSHHFVPSHLLPMSSRHPP